MKNLILAAGVAALAISVPAAADRGGKGGDKKSQSAKAERGGGKARASGEDRQKARSSNRQQARSGNRDKARSARAERQRPAKAERKQERRAERQRAVKSERQQERRAESQRSNKTERQQERRAERARESRSERIRDRRQEANRNSVERQRDERRIVERLRDRRQDLRERQRSFARLDDRGEFRKFDRDRYERRFAALASGRNFGDNCPPGLAKQNHLCLPPGQFRKLGERLPERYRSQALPLSLRDYYRDTDDYYYRYGDGYAYRVDRGDQLIRAVLPLIGAGLGIGMPFPYSSPNYHVPTTYQSFYPDSPYSYHRYANGYVYEIDRNSGMIEDMIPLLDQGYGVGQMLPASYSYYNVPDPYRSWYQDDDDYLYRYAPGAIYQVDRDTQLITAIASLLMGSGNGLAVGQQLPMGYDMYNVPYAYRDRYYDTPNDWYRYSNGNIYQVDPTTRLIKAVVDAIV